MNKLLTAITVTIGVVAVSVNTFAANVDIPEELQRKIDEREAGNYTEGTALTHDDFYLYTNDEELAPFDYNVLESLLAEGELGYFTNIYPLDDIENEYQLEGSDDVYITYRGIDLTNSTKESVLSKYGMGVDGRFDQTTDELYQGMSGEGMNEAVLLLDRACSYLLYTYQESGQIKFYFDTDNALVFTCFCSGINMYAEKPCIKKVQRYLNKNGYELGNPDGVVGPKTSAAITSYKEDHGLVVNDRVDDELMKCIYEEEKGIEESEKETEIQSETEGEENAEQNSPASETELDIRNPYRTDISYEALMRNSSDYYGQLYTFTGSVLQLFDTNRIRLALKGNSDEQVVCSYGWLSMPSDLMEGDTITVYGAFEGKEKYASVLGVDTEFPEFICYKMETPGGTAKPWAPQQIDSVKRAEEKALSKG